MILYIVIPCYNEEEALPFTSVKLSEKLKTLIENNKIDRKSKILFVDDGSSDKTWTVLKQLNLENKLFSCIKLSRNRGHQNALLAGLMYAKDKADIVISMDADLQDDINAVDAMIEEYKNGSDVVYGVRNKREKDTFFKKFTAEFYYKLLNKMGADIVFNHADYRLMSKKALEGLSQFKEKNLFLRGLVPLVGYKNSKVFYDRNERIAGESKYPLKKMLAFAFEGISSFSIKPIRFISFLGGFVFFISIFVLLWSFIQFLRGRTVSGWSSVIFSIWALCGLILLSIGIIGEYIGKIYMEVKERPSYIIEDILNNEDFNYEKNVEEK